MRLLMENRLNLSTEAGVLSPLLRVLALRSCTVPANVRRRLLEGNPVQIPKILILLRVVLARLVMEQW